MRILELTSGLIALGLLHASCGEVGSGSPAGGQGGVAASNGGEPGAGADAGDAGGHGLAGGHDGAAGEPFTSSGGAPTGEAGREQGPAGASGVVEGGGVPGLGGAGDGGNGPACSGAREGESCSTPDDGPCVFDAEVCLCDVSGFRDEIDILSWSCFPRGCPAMPPGPRQCTTTTTDETPVECQYGDRVCTCDARLGETRLWNCPMVCPSVRPADHEPCVPGALTPNDPDDRCTYDSGTCQCEYIAPAKNYDAEWACADNASGGAPN